MSMNINVKPAVQLKQRIVRAISRTKYEPAPDVCNQAAAEGQELEQVSGSVCSRTLSLLTGSQLDSETAKQTWKRIHEHWQLLNNQLQRDVGFYVAALDYFENVDRQSESRYVFMEAARFNNLVEQSTVDGLTQLYNHKTFIMLLEKELDFALRKNQSVALLMADIDNFKTINDRFGHQCGDDVLVGVAGILKQNLRVMDIAGRYGGEEFIVAFPATELNTAKDISERIRQKIEISFEPGAGITISMGIATYPQTQGGIQQLISAADKALYRAKHSGKNQLYCFQY